MTGIRSDRAPRTIESNGSHANGAPFLDSAAQRLSTRPPNWPGFLQEFSLFQGAVNLRPLIWTLQSHFPAGASLLEVGFGSGTTAALLSDLGFAVTACDIDPELVLRMTSKYRDWIIQRRITFEQADMFQLPWPDESFDVAYHQGVLEHFPDDQIVSALREQARVARFVLFDVPNHRYPDRPFGDERLLPISRWRALIRAAGLTVVEERGREYPHWLYFLPHAFFTRRALDAVPWFSRRFAVSSIFLCRSDS